MDNAVPEFWKVDRMPEATPRCSAGTLPMIEDVLGAANMPLPIAVEADQDRERPVGEVTGSGTMPTNVAPNNSMPAVENPRAPNRSDSVPANGPANRNPAVRGSRKMPAHSGVSAKS